MFQHVVDSLPSKKLVGKRHFTEPVEKQRQVVVVIQLLNFYLKGEREETPRENDVRQSGRARCDAVADRTGRGTGLREDRMDQSLREPGLCRHALVCHQ